MTASTLRQAFTVMLAAFFSKVLACVEKLKSAFDNWTTELADNHADRLSPGAILILSSRQYASHVKILTFTKLATLFVLAQLATIVIEWGLDTLLHPPNYLIALITRCSVKK